MLRSSATACVLGLGAALWTACTSTAGSSPDDTNARALASPGAVQSSPSGVSAPINCSTAACTSADEPTTGGYRMFDARNFDPVVDGWGRTRQFYVHIPANYDLVDPDSIDTPQKIPVIFAFHGGGEQRQDMIDGKWGDYFDQDYAFVIPLGAPDPCDGSKLQWLEPGGVGSRSTPSALHCNPATRVVPSPGATPLTYWNTSLADSFTDVLFIEQLRSAVLAAFPKLNANKVYATGFSAGGGMTFSLACYRGNLFRGFSVVAKTLGTASVRGDYDNSGDTDPLSLVATCGRNELDPAHATGITAPQLWGSGNISLPHPLGGTITVPFVLSRPVALFVGGNDSSPTEISDTGLFIRDHNNLNTMYTRQDPFMQNVPDADSASTERRTYDTAADAVWPSSTFRRFLVSSTLSTSAGHAIPDVDLCSPPPGRNIMTCDYDYTDQTILFFEDHADLNLDP